MYLLKLWNKKYGNDAQFIVFDKKAEKYAEFTPVRPKDTTWVREDLTKLDEYKDWESFEDEPIENLSQVIM